MSHLTTVSRGYSPVASRPINPALAMSRLEKEATLQAVQQGITQIVALVNILFSFLAPRS